MHRAVAKVFPSHRGDLNGSPGWGRSASREGEEGEPERAQGEVSGGSFLRDGRRKRTSCTSPSFLRCLIPLSLHNSRSWLLVLFPLLNEAAGAARFSLSACVSASLCVSHEIKSLKKIKTDVTFKMVTAKQAGARWCFQSLQGRGPAGLGLDTRPGSGARSGPSGPRGQGCPSPRTGRAPE